MTDRMTDRETGPPDDPVRFGASYALAVLGSSDVPSADAMLPPWPVIGIGPLDADDAGRVDVVAPTERLRGRIIAAIERNPRAAMVLVQVLRATERLDPARALPIESLAFATLQASGEFARWRASRPLVPVVPDEEPVLLDRQGDHLDIVLNRPHALNAIDRAMRDALDAAFELVAFDPSIASVRVRGRGRNFSVGGDLGEFGTMRDPTVAHEIRCLALPVRHLLAHRARVRFHLHGACVGAGIELAAFGGKVVAHPDAWFQLPELAMGLIPGMGGCVSIPQRIGRQRTALMVLTGKRITAATALQWGLIDAIAPTL